MTIAFWSPFSFSGRKSTNLLLLAGQAVHESGKEQLVIHSDDTGSGPEHFLLNGKNRKRMEVQKEFGVELLYKQLRCERFDKSLVVNSAYSFLSDRLHVLPAGSGFFCQEERENAAERLNAIINRADHVFEHVFVEVPSGYSDYSNKLCENAKLVIINLSQSPYELFRFGEIPAYSNELFLIGAYEKQCIYSVHNLSALLKRLHGKCYGIPYNRKLLESCAKGEMERFLQLMSFEKEKEDFQPFSEAVEKAFHGIKKQG